MSFNGRGMDYIYGWFYGPKSTSVSEEYKNGVEKQKKGLNVNPEERPEKEDSFVSISDPKESVIVVSDYTNIEPKESLSITTNLPLDEIETGKEKGVNGENRLFKQSPHLISRRLFRRVSSQGKGSNSNFPFRTTKRVARIHQPKRSVCSYRQRQW